MISADEALKQLKEGNARFVQGESSISSPIQQIQDKNISESQAPFAIILGCSDSRVPAEIVFDQGLGDLFVVRVAGNIVAPSQIGSVEFAVEQFGTPLIVVLGHTYCGAIKATLDSFESPLKSEHSIGNIHSIVKRIRPTLSPLYNSALKNQPDELLRTAIHANIMASVIQLRSSSQILEHYLAEGKIQIVGAEYDIKTGEVRFLED